MNRRQFLQASAAGLLLAGTRYAGEFQDRKPREVDVATAQESDVGPRKRGGHALAGDVVTDGAQHVSQTIFLARSDRSKDGEALWRHTLTIAGIGRWVVRVAADYRTRSRLWQGAPAHARGRWGQARTWCTSNLRPLTFVE